MTLTDLEKKVLKKLFDGAAMNGHDFGDPLDGRSVVNSPKQLSGIIASLVKKKIFKIWYDEINDEKVEQFTWVMPVEEVEMLLKG
jgi:hypothetical protein